ncbi:MAG: sulfatase, partial [Phycisphaerales bacterium]
APSPSGETDSATLGWQAGPGVADLQVRDGRLTGRSTSDCPIIHAERTVGLDDPHQICAYEIRMRVSAGVKLALMRRPSEKLDLEKITDAAKEGRGYAALIATDNEMHTYTLRRRRPKPSSGIRHVLIRPTDVQGATFEIEFVRVLSRKEYFASNSPLVSWQGLAGIFHQTLVAKTPEVIRFPLSVPDRPWLDLALGTVEDGPLTFQVKIRPVGGRAEDALLLARTITTPHRWEPVKVDLSDYAGKEVNLSLSLTAEQEVAVGFWGAPVIRNSGAIPPPAISDSDAFSKETPQGVILIWADALRSDHLNAYGYSRETAPVLSRMAAQGALFHDCVSQATWTLPSTSSLLTSLYVTTHGVKDGSPPDYDRLPMVATIMPEVFHDAGYATLLFSSVWFVGRYFNMHQGFDESHEYDSLDWAKPNSNKTAREYVDRLLPWLEAHREVPFFVFLHVYDPHAPYEPYPPYDTFWADPARKKEHETYVERAKEYIVSPQRKNSGMPLLKELEEAGIDPDDFISLRKDWYDGSIRGMDAEIGRLLERLEELGLDDKTLVIFISDHGEEFLDHGKTGHGAIGVYSELTHVPLIVKWPGVVPEGAEVFETVRTIDVMPTILELCHLPLPKGMQGQSLVPLLAAARRTPSESTATSQRNIASTAGQWRNEPAVSENLLSEREKRRDPEKRDSYASILDGWKLNYYEPLEGNPEYELYDHRKDPLDQVNLADKHPEIVKRLTEEFKTWKEKATAARLTPDSELEKTLTEEQLQHLRSLGYIR